MNSIARKKSKWRTSLLLVTLLLQACATVPPVAQTCPELPPPPVREQLGRTFLSEMQEILSASQPAPIDYALPSANAKPGLKP